MTIDRKSTRLNSSHLVISYAVFCLKKTDIHTLIPRLANSREGGRPAPAAGARGRGRSWGGVRALGLHPQSVSHLFVFFFFNDTATTEIYTLSLHDALPI